MARLNARSISARLVSTASRVVAISADRRTLASLVVDPDVERISDDAVVQSSGVTWTSTTPTTPKDNRVMRTLGMDYWVPDGKGVVVAVIDSGVVANSDLQSAAKYDFMSGAPKSVAGGDLCFDSYGHGSHVASLIANVGASSDKVYAVSPAGRRLWRSRCSTQMEPATPATLLQQSTSALRTEMQLKIDIINLSLGHPILEPAAEDPLVQAVERAARAGIAVIASAGNHGRNIATGQVGFGGVTSPGNAPSAITVGSIDFKGPKHCRTTLSPPTAREGRHEPTVRQAGCRRCGPPSGRLDGQAEHAVDKVREQRHRHARRRPQVPYLERDEHGRSGHERCRRAGPEDDAPGDRHFNVDVRRQDSSLNCQNDSEPLYPLRGSRLHDTQTGMTPSLLKAISQFTALPLPDAHVRNRVQEN